MTFIQQQIIAKYKLYRLLEEEIIACMGCTLDKKYLRSICTGSRKTERNYETLSLINDAIDKAIVIKKQIYNNEMGVI